MVGHTIVTKEKRFQIGRFFKKSAFLTQTILVILIFLLTVAIDWKAFGVIYPPSSKHKEV